MSFRMHFRVYAAAVAAGLIVAGCGSQNTGMAPSNTMPAQPMSAGAAANAPDKTPDSGNSILAQLTNQVVIGSTIDPSFGQLNPYGLTVAPSTNGMLTQGDLVVCNFNASSNVQGTGYTIVALHPMPGSTPTLIDADPTTLTGCNALALAPNDTIWAAAFVSNGNPIISPSGTLIKNLTGAPFNHPFGEAYANPKHGTPAFYVSNAGDGTIVRINLDSSLSMQVIAKGFPVNHGPPGSILGPSGLQYERKTDTLFVVDGANNSVTAIKNVSSIGGVVCLQVRDRGRHFAGRFAAHARVLIMGAPLNGPISSALLFDGHLVIGNTLDPDGKNLMIEIGRNGKVLDVRNVDTGAAGALFGMVATGTNAANTKLYFNDDNDNNLQVLEH
jgi:hypothetical protein